MFDFCDGTVDLDLHAANRIDCDCRVKCVGGQDFEEQHRMDNVLKALFAKRAALCRFGSRNRAGDRLDTQDLLAVRGRRSGGQ